MKKKLFCLLLILVLPVCLLFTGCATKVENKQQNEEHLFVCVDSFIPSGESYGCYVMVHKETRIMYLMQNEGGITVMVDKYGNPLIYYGAL